MKKRLVITKVVSIMLLLAAVQAQELFPSDYPSSEETSLLSESEFPQDSEDTNLRLQTQQVPLKTQSFSEETSLPSDSEFPQDSEGTSLPLETQQLPIETQSFSGETSLPPEFVFPQDSEDNSLPLETQQLPIETDSHSEIRPPPQSPAPLPSETPSPPETPLPTQAPISPKRPWTPENTCKTKCATACMSKKVPILHNLCNKVCRKRCILLYSQLIYNCTNHCAESMPKNFKSDKKKVAGYAKYCYQKCINKF
ncbi:uncharacterized protein LOC110421688 [Herrania umbratica]|uniref:Uncharacterized protein LOC110421688 n=1 Tax=Herrania umbratica TaxID=108875 RepID=A0A6J1AV02_9ROSI|nr:uncharacterized protein LOC110421688 [Herrania umbratica]